MQTIHINASQSGASGQSSLLPSVAGQPPVGIGGDGEGFSAILGDNGNPDAGPATVGVAGAEVLASAPVMFGMAFPSQMSVVAATEVSAFVPGGSDLTMTGSSPGILPQAGIFQKHVAPSDLSISGVPAPVVARAGLALGVPPAGPESAQLTLGAAVLASSPGGDTSPLPQGSASSAANSPERPGSGQPDKTSAESKYGTAADPSVRMDTSVKMSLADPNAARPDASPSLMVDANLAPRQAGVAMPVATDVTLANGAGAALMIASTFGSFGTKVPGLVQGMQNGSDGSLPDVVPQPPAVLRDALLPAGEEVLKGPKTTLADTGAPDDIRVQRDPPTVAILPKVEQAVLAGSPVSAAESLWRGAALARLSGSGAATDRPVDLAAAGVNVLRTAEAGNPVLAPGADGIGSQAALPAIGPLSTAQDAGLAGAPNRTQDPVPASSGHFPGPAAGSSGGTAMQPTHPARDGAQAALPTDLTSPAEGEVLPDPDLAMSAGFTSSTASLLPLFAATLSAGSHLPTTIAHLSGQVATALVQHPDGLTDIALSPEELGRVRMTLHADALQPDRMVIFLSFDRPETLELFRRHADLLAEAMRLAGYSGTDISFGQSGTGAGGSFGAGTDQGHFAQGGSSAQLLAQSTSRLPDPAIGPGDLKSPPLGAATALDLRL